MTTFLSSEAYKYETISKIENKLNRWPYVDYNQWLRRLDTQLNEPTNQNSLKVVKPMNKRTLL